MRRRKWYLFNILLFPEISIVAVVVVAVNAVDAAGVKWWSVVDVVSVVDVDSVVDVVSVVCFTNWEIMLEPTQRCTRISCIILTK